MNKLVVGEKAKNAIDITKSVTENLNRIAEAEGKKVNDLMVYILDKPRHKAMIEEMGITVPVALHLDHGSYEGCKKCIEAGFSSIMFDGSHFSIEENIEKTKELVALAHANGMSLEAEVGSIGGEEDGVVGEINEKLYTSTADGIKTVEALGLGENGRYITALTFGNVHGAYKPGHVKLRPELLGTIQKEVAEHFGLDHRPFDLVMHGGSGSTAEEIATAVANGVIKMNVDTDTQYAFTRPVVDHMMRNYDGVLKIDGEVGVKKQYDPRTWGKSAEAGMAARVVEACERLGATGTQMR